MDWPTVLRGIDAMLESDEERAEKVVQIAAAVAARDAVVVNDVTADPRYLTAFASTLSEAIIPVLDPGTGAVVGTLDVEGGERDAFTDADRQALERVAAATATLFA
jgi:putative methionine-R-sulfoxide reductase with GAF domain